MSERYDAFISYHSSDLSLAQATVKILEFAELSVWWDQGTRDNPAQGTVSEIRLHLMPPMLLECRYLVFLSSTLALFSDWVIVELSSFVDARRPVVIWHPREDGNALNDLQSRGSPKTYKEVIRLLKSDRIIARYDRPRNDVTFVAKNIAQNLRLFKYIDSRGIYITEETVISNMPDYMKHDMDFLMELASFPG